MEFGRFFFGFGFSSLLEVFIAEVHRGVRRVGVLTNVALFFFAHLFNLTGFRVFGYFETHFIFLQSSGLIAVPEAANDNDR